METKLEKLVHILNQKPQLSSREAQALGFSRAELKLWCDQQKIFRVSRGFYSLDVSSETSAEKIATINPPVAMAGISALTHYGYTNYIERETWVLIPQGRPPINRPGIQSIRQKLDSFNLGLDPLETRWGTIQITNREKTIIDALKGKYLDLEEKIRVFKRWLRDPKRNRRRFSDYATRLKLGSQYREWLIYQEGDT